MNRELWKTSHTLGLVKWDAMLEALFLLYFLVLLATLVFKSRIVTGPWLFFAAGIFSELEIFSRNRQCPPPLCSLGATEDSARRRPAMV